MKRLLILAALSLACIASFGATLNPIQLLNPAGSTAGQAIISTGPSSAPAWSTTFSSATLTGLFTAGNGIFTIAGTNTGTAQRGLMFANDGTWSPSAASGNFNAYTGVSIQASSMTGGTVAQRWTASNNVNETVVTTSGPPTGTPSTPTGMADGHTIGYASIETIPAGLCDGLNGSGFTGPGGAPGNNCYQEIGGFENTATILSPGHYVEGIGSFVNDNNGGAGVPIRANAFFVAMNKASATNTYPTYGFAAFSDGAQQTTFAPTAAFRVDGGWLTSLDLSGNTYSGAASINLPGNQKINADSNNLFFGVNGSNALVLNPISSALLGELSITDSSTSSSPTLSVNATSSTIGANIHLVGNGVTTPSKTLNVTNGTFNIFNNAFNSALFSLTDAGTASFTGLIAPTSSIGIKGTTAADNAQAGSDGEYLPNSTLGVSMTTGTPTNCTSESLTAGDWDVTGVIQFNPAAGTTVSGFFAGASTTSATFGAAGTFQQLTATFTAGATHDSIVVPTQRINVASTATVFVVGQSTFASGTMTCDGFIRARRIR